MKRCVTNWIYLEKERNKGFDSLFKNLPYFFYCVKNGNNPFKRSPQIKEDKRSEGLDLPSNAHTMIGLKRLENIQHCIEDVLLDDIPGDFIEAGVWRGGDSIFMRAMLKAYNITDRKVWLADSFAGLPKPNAKKYPSDAGNYFNISHN